MTELDLLLKRIFDGGCAAYRARSPRSANPWRASEVTGACDAWDAGWLAQEQFLARTERSSDYGSPSV